jgi:hypothetical protein
MEFFVHGYYTVKWYNAKGEEVHSEDKYLTSAEYGREIAKMQTAFLQGKDVASMQAIPTPGKNKLIHLHMGKLVK